MNAVELPKFLDYFRSATNISRWPVETSVTWKVADSISSKLHEQLTPTKNWSMRSVTNDATGGGLWSRSG